MRGCELCFQFRWRREKLCRKRHEGGRRGRGHGRVPFQPQIALSGFLYSQASLIWHPSSHVYHTHVTFPGWRGGGDGVDGGELGAFVSTITTKGCRQGRANKGKRGEAPPSGEERSLTQMHREAVSEVLLKFYGFRAVSCVFGNNGFRDAEGLTHRDSAVRDVQNLSGITSKLARESFFFVVPNFSASLAAVTEESPPSRSHTSKQATMPPRLREAPQMTPEQTPIAHKVRTTYQRQTSLASAESWHMPRRAGRSRTRRVHAACTSGPLRRPEGRDDAQHCRAFTSATQEDRSYR